ncbi:MAG: hypothetical protein KIS72_12430 [Luteimonas sp.]|nr:hypothetical protein [Luteimonas sp.]
MHKQSMPAKTEQGRAEIDSRARRLQAGLRSVLLLVDGRRTVAELQELAKRLHAPDDALQQLLSLQLISGDTVDTVAAPAANEPVASGPTNRYGVLYALMTDAVREQLGVLGYLFQLKLERAATDTELEALLPDLQAALAKRTSVQGATSTIERIRMAACAA